MTASTFLLYDVCGTLVRTFWVVAATDFGAGVLWIWNKSITLALGFDACMCDLYRSLVYILGMVSGPAIEIRCTE
jgi:hypothetical protein